MFLDGDYSDRPEELPALIGPILDGHADIVIGSRLAGKREAGALPLHSVAGNWTAAALIRLLYGVAITDLGPFRAASGEAIRALQLRETSYGWAVEIDRAGSAGGRAHHRGSGELSPADRHIEDHGHRSGIARSGVVHLRQNPAVSLELADGFRIDGVRCAAMTIASSRS